MVTCPECQGDGKMDLYCPSCSGSGEGYTESAACRICGGSGEYRSICGVCSGRGELTAEDVAAILEKLEATRLELLQEKRKAVLHAEVEAPYFPLQCLHCGNDYSKWDWKNIKLEGYLINGAGKLIEARRCTCGELLVGSAPKEARQCVNRINRAD